MKVMIDSEEKSYPLSRPAMSGSLGFNNPVLKEVRR